MISPHVTVRKAKVVAPPHTPERLIGSISMAFGPKPLTEERPTKDT
jgi:hypothetical protein